jgi:hypothetical protein
MNASGSGFLAIWSDVFPAEETDYLHWLVREHTSERVGVPGFLGVRVFKARSEAMCRYFILYRLENAAVIASPAYLERLNAPTEWSQKIMPILKNFVRGGGRIIAEEGAGTGTAILPIVCRTSDVAAVKAVLGAIRDSDRVVAVRLLEVDPDGTLIPTTEKAIRSDEQSFAALLLVEGLDDAALNAAMAVLKGATDVPERGTLCFDQIFSLDRAGLATKAA